MKRPQFSAAFFCDQGIKDERDDVFAWSIHENVTHDARILSKKQRNWMFSTWSFYI
jgi:hypothetical protein